MKSAPMTVVLCIYYVRNLTHFEGGAHLSHEFCGDYGGNEIEQNTDLVGFQL